LNSRLEGQKLTFDERVRRLGQKEKSIKRDDAFGEEEREPGF
jgi:hypothetical protein